MMNKWAALMCGLCVLVAGCARIEDTSRTFHTVVIDPGHGGKDSGTQSKRGGREKNNALDVALRLNQKLRDAGFHTVMTRTSDVFVPLEARAAISNAQTNAIFVSVHFNDSRKHRIHGAETYYKSQVSYALASHIEAKVSSLSGCDCRGVKTANYRVLRLNRFPAVLVECGFLSNPSEATRCATQQYHEQLAAKIAEGIVEQRYGKR